MVDLTKFRRDNRRNEYLVSCEQLSSMLTNNRHNLSYFHLTTWTKLCMMMKRVTVPDDGSEHRMLHLGAAVNMNDEYDKKCGKGIFFTSFSFGPAENISMWTNYGIPNKEAVRVRFYHRVFHKWYDDSRPGIRAYGVKSDGSLESLSAKPNLKLVDVAYWSPRIKQGGIVVPDQGIFIHNRNKFRLTDCSNVESFMKEKGQYMFKEAGWNYESEVRLVLEFDEDLADRYQRVAIPFDAPLDNLDDYFNNEVMYGPWFNPGKPIEDTAAGHRLEEAAKSHYWGIVNMRSVCDDCPEIDSGKCICEFKQQR